MIQVDNKVYVKYKGGHNHRVQLKERNNKSYYFTTQNYISLALVDPEDLNAILNVKKNCCNGSGRRICVLADEVDIRRYTEGGR